MLHLVGYKLELYHSLLCKITEEQGFVISTLKKNVSLKVRRFTVD